MSSPLRLKREGDIYRILSIVPSGNWEFRVGRETVWFGNCEDEGCSMWLLDHPDEFYDDSIFYGGYRSLCQFRSQQNVTLATHFENRLPCYADTAGYTLYGHLRTDNGNNAEVRIRFYQSRTSGFSIGWETTGQITGTNEWTYYYKNFTPASGTNFFDVWLRSEGPDAGDGYAWFDNIGVVSWEDWESLSAVDDVVTPNDYYWIQIRTGVQTPEAAISYDEKIFEIQPALNEYASKEVAPTSLRCYPNPGRSPITIAYYLAETVEVNIRVYNILGQEVRTLNIGNQSAGHRSIHWDGCDNKGRQLSAGVYFCRIQPSVNEGSTKIILLRNK